MYNTKEWIVFISRQIMSKKLPFSNLPFSQRNVFLIKNEAVFYLNLSFLTKF